MFTISGKMLSRNIADEHSKSGDTPTDVVSFFKNGIGSSDGKGIIYRPYLEGSMDGEPFNILAVRAARAAQVLGDGPVAVERANGNLSMVATRTGAGALVPIEGPAYWSPYGKMPDSFEMLEQGSYSIIVVDKQSLRRIVDALDDEVSSRKLVIGVPPYDGQALMLTNGQEVATLLTYKGVSSERYMDLEALAVPLHKPKEAIDEE